MQRTQVMGTVCWPMLFEAAAYFGMAGCALLVAVHAQPSAANSQESQMVLVAPGAPGGLYRLAAGFAATVGIITAVQAVLS